jgi:rsbT co-antagonist protein RsbR
MAVEQKKLVEILKYHESAIFEDWMTNLSANLSRREIESDLHLQAKQVLRGLILGLSLGDPENINGPAWTDIKQLLTEISEQRTLKGLGPVETATFVFSMKQPIFLRLRKEIQAKDETLAMDTWLISSVIDKLGLFTMEVFQRGRESVIVRQQQELLELSTPVVELWDNILALPLIGTLDSNRTQVVMQSLLQKIVDTGAPIAIIDITGVPTVDTLVAQHLLKTVAAARLMGADCIISGIRPQIAQTIVHLGVNLEDVITKASLADAFAIALKRTGLKVVQLSTG